VKLEVSTVHRTKNLKMHLKDLMTLRTFMFLVPTPFCSFGNLVM
jgi:hypothetical protein